MKKLLIISGIIIVIAFIVWGNMSRDKTKVISVQMEAIQRKTIEQVVSAAGNIKPVTEVKLSANVSSEIMDIKVVEGDQVIIGQILVILDSLRYSAIVSQSRSALNAANASFEKVKSEFDRASRLFDNNLISNQELEALEATYKLSVSNVEQSRARLEQSLDDLHKTILKSPMNGTVTAVRKETGEMALGSMFQADVILIISDLSEMEVIVDVDETDVVDIDLNNKVKIEVDAIPDLTLSGFVTQIAKSATSSSGLQQDDIVNYEVRIMIDMSTMTEDILPGMSATSNITTAMSENAIAIPIQSLTARPKNEDNDEEEDGDLSLYTKEKEILEDVVFIAVADTAKNTGFSFGKKKDDIFVTVKKKVEIGISSNNFYELLSGVDEGDLIITGNYKSINKELKNGSKVKKKKRESFRGKKNEDD